MAGHPENYAINPINEELELDSETGNGCGCGCFRFFGFTTSEDKARLLTQDTGECKRETSSWVVTQLKKLKGLSEIVAGPKWKNLVRKMGAYFNDKKKRNSNYDQYDSYNYALNFDHGIDDYDEDGLALGFSSRFAAPPLHNNQRPS